MVEDGWIYSLNKEQLQWMVAEVEWRESAGTVELVGLGLAGIHYVSPVFLVPKKGPKRWWMVINMQAVNKGLAKQMCKFKGLSAVAQMARQGWWMLTFNLAQGYHHVMVEESTQELLGF